MTSPEAEAAQAVVRPYESLAPIYDFVMRHVDYGHWAGHVHALLRRHACAPDSLVELACGTGNATFALADLGYDVAGYDASREMVSVARQKAVRRGRDLRFGVRDLRNLAGIGVYGAAACLYDSVNYLLTLDHVAEALAQVHDVLAPGGIFIFDVCTERNSMQHFRDVRDAEQGPGFLYTRHSYYDAAERLQYNAFDIRRDDGSRRQETHVQRIYPLDELAARLRASRFELLEALDGFSLRPGSDGSDRVHFVLRRT